MGPFFAKTCAGLVIRANAVELLALKGSRVESHARVPIAGGERRDLSEAIKQALAVSGLKTNRLAIALPTADVLIRFFLMPLMPKAERDTAIQFEARKYVPFKTEALVWDYHVTEAKEPQKLEVTFAAVQRAVFQELQTALADAGVQPTRMEPRSLSLARLAVLPKGPAVDPHAFVCLVDVDEDHAHLVVARAGVPVLTRDVALADITGEAEATPDPKAKRLCSELRVSMDFFTREYPSATISKVILVGDEGLIDPWRPWLAGELGCVVEVGRDLMGRVVEDGLPLSFASAVGLVHCGGSERADLLPLDFLRRSTIKATSAPARPGRITAATRWVRELTSAQSLATVSAVAGALTVLWFYGSHQVAREQQRLTHLVQARPAVGWGLEGMDLPNVGLVREKALQQLERLKRVVDGRIGVVAKLDALARSLSEGMWLTEVIFEEKPDASEKDQLMMKVSGACYLEQVGRELSAIQAFETRVKNTPALFQGFHTASVQQIKEQIKARDNAQYTYRTFQLHCRSDRKM